MKAAWLRGSPWERLALWWQGERAEESGPLDIFRELENAARILIVPNDRVGGLVLGAPVCKAIRDRYPKARIALLVDEQKGPIARQLPFADEVVTGALGRPIWSGALRAVRERLRQGAFDLSICLGADCSFRLAWLCSSCGARLRLGFSRIGLKPFNVEIVPGTAEVFEGARYLALVRLLGLEAVGQVRWAVEPERAAQIRARYLDEENTRNAIAVDLSGGEGKGLGRRQLEDLVGRIIERGARAVLFFSPAERRQLSYLQKNYGTRVLPFAQGDLAGAVALLAGCRALVACNTDLLHLARALQVPAVGIFAEDPRRWLPADSSGIALIQTRDVRGVNIAQIIQTLEQALGGGQPAAPKEE